MKKLEKEKTIQSSKKPNNQEKGDVLHPQVKSKKQNLSRLITKYSSFRLKVLLVLLVVSLPIVIAGILAKYLLPNQTISQDDLNSPSLSDTWQTPTPDTTENWKTYTNEKYLFSFKYPRGWTNTKLEDENVIISVGDYADFMGAGMGGEIPLSFSISIFDKKDYQQENIESYINPDEYLNPIKDTVLIDNQKTEKRTYNNYTPEAAEVTDYYINFELGDKILVLYFTYETAGCSIQPEAFQKECSQKMELFKNQYEDIIDQILSTFKFLDQEQTITGTVVENNLGCEMDGECYLIVDTGDEKMRIIYHYGEWPRCKNEISVQYGLMVEEGDEIEVFGKPTIGGNLSTCDLEEYHIKVLSRDCPEGQELKRCQLGPCCCPIGAFCD